MKTKLFFACCVALIVSLTAACAQQNLAQTSQTDVQTDVQTQSSNDMNNRSTIFSSQQSNESSGYQHSSLNLKAVDLKQPHILRINSSASQLSGEITVNGKVVKRFNNTQEINLSPLLSVGEHKVQVSAHYAPASSEVKLEMNGPGTNVTQQTSGNGTVNYTLDLSVR